MIRRLLLLAAAPVAAAVSIGPVTDRLARRLLSAPRRQPGESGLAPALDRLGGEVVRLRSRDGVRLTGRWVPATAPGEAAGVGERAADAGGASDSAEGAGAAPAGDGDWIPDPHEAVLLLHGYSGSVAPDLVEHGPYLRRTASVLGLDFRGHGGSDDGPTTFGLLEVEDVAGALAWLGERGVRRVALVGSSMGGVTALAAVAVLGDGRLDAADADPDAPAATVEAPRPVIVAVVAESATPELASLVGRRLGVPGGRRLAARAFGRFESLVGGDPRRTQPIAVVGLLEDVPLLLIHGGADRLVPHADARRLASAAPAGTRHLVIDGAGHSAEHATEPAMVEAAVTAHLRAAFGGARG